ncbi:MAG TPA: glycosyltransferase, partial [Pyrinomonadaceae bacterium]|nr:glycosyltransferase [Pyrinomonadaceae bacterium]
MLILPASALLCVAVWNALAWPRVATVCRDLEQPAALVSILIPARNEEMNLAACLRAALAQGGEVVREVLVYDDHSTDKTPDIVNEFAQRDARVRLIAAAPLPSG